MHSSYFMETFPFRVRQAEGRRMTMKFPTMVPVIVEKVPRVQMMGVRSHFMLPRSFTFQKFYTFMRAHLNLKEDENLVLHINDFIPEPGNTLGAIYECHRHEDYILYIAYSNGTLDNKNIKLTDRCPDVRRPLERRNKD